MMAANVAEIGFGARWLRPIDPMYTEPLLKLGAADDVSGGIGSCSTIDGVDLPSAAANAWGASSNAGWWTPNLLDIPVQAWLNHHNISYALGSCRSPPVSIAPAWAYGDGTKGDDGHFIGSTEHRVQVLDSVYKQPNTYMYFEYFFYLR